jgi:hypothetical protein
MEILRVTDKCQYLIDFVSKSKYQESQLIKNFYPKYINQHQINSEAIEAFPSNDEVPRPINEHKITLDKKHKNHFVGITITFGVNLIIIYLQILGEILEIKSLLLK